MDSDCARFSDSKKYTSSPNVSIARSLLACSVLIWAALKSVTLVLYDVSYYRSDYSNFDTDKHIEAEAVHAKLKDALVYAKGYVECQTSVKTKYNQVRDLPACNHLEILFK